MGRSRYTVSRDKRPAKRRGTPALSRRYKNRRLLPKKLCETIMEEPDLEERMVPSVKPVSTARTRVKPVSCKSVLPSTRPAHSRNPRHTASSPNKQNSANRVSPAQLPPVQTTPDPRKEEEGSSTATPESTTSSNAEEDATFSSDVDDDDYYYSTASSSSSSLPSPEIFRREICESDFLHEGGGSGSHKKLYIAGYEPRRDPPHAGPPELSTIIDASSILAEEICDIRNHKGPEAETSTQTGPVQPDKSTAKPRKQSSCLSQVTSKRPILCKKKVSFKTPTIAADTFGSKHGLATRSATDNETSSPVKGTRPDEETFDFKDETPRLTVKLQRPVEKSPETVKLFDFVSDSERDMLFEMMRERSAKLKNIPLFPLTAAEMT